MTKIRKAALLLLASFLLCLALTTAYASNLDTIGVTLLRQVTTNLNGSGIHVGQAEAQATGNGDWEVNPGATNPAVNLPVSDFSYHSNSTATTFPNSLGTESGHADTVAQFFYGLPLGVATNVAHIDEYEADYFINYVIPSPYQTAISNKIVNQSFIFYPFTSSQQISINTNYDNYAARYGTLFISGVGDGSPTPVSPPGTCYNGIGVGAYGTSASSIGPTTDNGRSKPDITAPADSTSDSAPLVSGAATILQQAGLRGDGGAATNLASDARLLKALLLNGALKPIDWTNGNASPLDARYGAGVLNVFESYKQLAGGQHTYIASNGVPTGNAHPPTSATNNISSLVGWDFNTNTSSGADDVINHYYFNLVTTNATNATFTGTTTLVWGRQQNKIAINELDLYLYNVATTNLIARSSNSVDNVKHLFVPQLPSGRYDLQVLKKGGSGTNFVSASQTYALAFEFFSLKLGVTHSGGNIVLTWPVFPAGFTLESTASLNAPISWSGVNTTPVVTNNQNSVTISTTAGNQFFRLVRP